MKTRLLSVILVVAVIGCGSSAKGKGAHAVVPPPSGEWATTTGFPEPPARGVGGSTVVVPPVAPAASASATATASAAPAQPTSKVVYSCLPYAANLELANGSMVPIPVGEGLLPCDSMLTLLPAPGNATGIKVFGPVKVVPGMFGFSVQIVDTRAGQMIEIAVGNSAPIKLMTGALPVVGVPAPAPTAAK